MKAAVLASTVFFGLVGLASAATVDVTTCPASVPAYTVGVVQADLDCTGATGTGYVVLGRGAVLDLNGHSLTFNLGDPALALVSCDSNCGLQGPGTLTASGLGWASIWVGGAGVVTVQDLTIEGMVNGIVDIDGRVIVANTSISAQQWGIAGARKAALDGVTVAVTAPGGYCIGATAEIRSSVVGQNVTLTSCVDGIWASGKVRLDGLTATNNSGVGVYSAKRLVLKNSSVAGSGPIDLLSGRRPVLLNTTCDTSAQDTTDPVLPTWGVCALD
jgi:hypothetical protein